MHVPPGIDALATLAPTNELTPIALFGAAEAGVSYAPLNFRLPEAVQGELLDRIRPSRSSTPPGRSPTRARGRIPRNPTTPQCCLFTSGTSSTPEGRRARPRQPPRVRVQHARLRVGRRGRSRPRRRAALPHRRSRRDPERDLRRSACRPARALRRSRLVHGRERRGGDARLRRADDAARASSRSSSTTAPPYHRRSAISPTAVPACPSRCSNAPSPCFPTLRSSTHTG